MGIKIQEEIARELLNTNATDITLIGILLVVCLFLGWVVVKLFNRTVKLEEERIKDIEKSQEIIVELAEKTVTAISQVTDLAKRQ